MVDHPPILFHPYRTRDFRRKGILIIGFYQDDFPFITVSGKSLPIGVFVDGIYGAGLEKSIGVSPSISVAIKFPASSNSGKSS